MAANGVRDGLSGRDKTFGDYREQGEQPSVTERDV
jgi:hypothetical protein